MAYMHIDNLYKNPAEILMFKQVFALEKVHGTSAHIMFKDGQVIYYSGGSKYDTFVALFDNEELYKGFMELGNNNVTVYGEACGGKIQKMRHLYGDNVRFVAFEVKVGDTWLNVPNAEEVVKGLGLEFVPYEQVDSTLKKLDELRDALSELAKRWGNEGGVREGIVIRPLVEITNNRGHRVIAKHKGKLFSETAQTQDIDPEKLAAMTAAEEIATKWVTDMRLAHILDAMEADYMMVNREEKQWDMKDTSPVIQRMIADIRRESEDEFEFDKPVAKFVGKRTAQMFQAWLAEKAFSGIAVEAI